MAMVYEADTLKETLRTNWALTGKLAAEGTVAADGQIRPVHFFARDQIEDKIVSKAVEVHKRSPLVTKQENEFFTNETDEIGIRVVYKVEGTSKKGFDESESNVEDIEEEVERILDLTFNPQTGIGIFFTRSLDWSDEDKINIPGKDAYIVRELTIRLTRIVSRSNNVFDSFQRGALFDLSASANMNTPPGADFNYTEVFNITENEGFRPREIPVTSHPDGAGVQLFYAGAFSGLILMNSKLKSDDIGTTSDKINQIKLRQSNGEYIEAAIVSTYTNNNAQTLTVTRIVHVIDVRITQGMSNLLEWQITAKIIKPSTLTVV